MRSSLIAGPSSDGLALQFEAWRSGIGYELNFWRNWFQTAGSEWPADFKSRLDPDLNWPSTTMAPSPGMKVLDVGAGPATFLPKRIDGSPIDITAVDPLAPFYEAMGKDCGVLFPVPTIQAFAEDLTALFDSETFDYVICRNALDHSFDPTRAIEEMLIVAKIGAPIHLQHTINEAENEGYSGFHQFNFDERDGRFVIWNKRGEVDVTQMFGDFADIEVTSNAERTWINVKLNKKLDLPLDIGLRRKERLQVSLSAILQVLQNIEVPA